MSLITIAVLLAAAPRVRANECLPDTELSVLADPNAAAGDEYGTAVSVDGYTAIVGAHLEDTGAPDSGRAYIIDTRDGSLIATLNNPTVSNGDWFGWSVGISGDRAVVGARFDDLTGNNAGRAYIHNAATGALVFQLPNPATNNGDEFGFACAISGDRVVVSAPSDDPGGVINAGRAYVFSVTTGALISTLSNPAPQTNDFFGYSVGISGGLVVVGAYLKDVGATDSGRAYVFNAETGALVSTLNNPTPALGDQFGWSAALSGTTAVVGAYRDDPGGVSNAGAAYIFDALTGALTATLLAPTAADGAFFGFSVAADGALVMVGAPLAPGPAGNAGEVYLFDAQSGLFLSSTASPGPTTDAQFGYAVSISGNVGVAGAPRENGPGSDAGSARAYSCGIPCEPDEPVEILSHIDPKAGDNFGAAVGLDGDIVAVGVPGEDALAGNTGTVFTFDARNGAPLAELSNPVTSAAGETFGAAVAVSGSIVIVGAPENDTGASAAGIAYLYNALSGGLLSTLPNPLPAAGDRFGYSAGISGGLAVVGAYGDDFGGVSSGAAHIFTVPGGTFLRTIGPPVPDSNDQFGGAVAICANLVVVGAIGDDEEGNNAGRAFVYDALTGTLLSTLINPAPTPSHGDIFGSSVAISGRVALVGSPDDDTGASNAGTAYLFDARTGAHLMTLNNPSPNSNDRFGVSVSIFSNTAAVGAWSNDEGALDTGAVYLFDVITGAQLFQLLNPSPATNDRFGYSVALTAETIAIGADRDQSVSPAVNTAGAVHLYACPGSVCCPGDANGSLGFVDALDFIAVQANFGAEVGVGGPGDANCSGGFIDALDFIAVQANFGADCG